MIKFPYAKINIGLHITGKREDGFHDIESIFYPIPLSDVLEALPSEEEGMHLEIRGIPIPSDGGENLCQKAFRLIKDRYPVPGIKAALLKNIPTGAGLGGGSSDGSAMINMIREMASLKMEQKEMLEVAAELGSDCPFFIESKAAYVSGRGEKLEAINLDLSGYYMVLVYPNIHVPTGKAYSLVHPRPGRFDLKTLPEIPIEDWKHHIQNDFEPGIFRLHPQIEAIRNAMYQGGALYASMTGSGSTVYGIFNQKPEGIEKFSRYFIWHGEL